jgi:RNA polymerase-binding transcription factor DksA
LTLNKQITSQLANRRSHLLNSIDTKAAHDKDNLKLENADFELGSAQFDMPPLNYKEQTHKTLSNRAESEMPQSIRKKKKQEAPLPSKL